MSKVRSFGIPSRRADARRSTFPVNGEGKSRSHYIKGTKRLFRALKNRSDTVCAMITCALCEQPAIAVQILPGGRARPVCILHDVPSARTKKPGQREKPPRDKDGGDRPGDRSALAAE
jgi:hypothetical protein